MPLHPEILPLGPNGLVVRFALRASPEATQAVRAFLAAFERSNIAGVKQTASSLVSVFVEFCPQTLPREVLLKSLHDLIEAQVWLTDDAPNPHRCWHVPVAFGDAHGPQLNEVAALAGLSADQAVTSLCQGPVEVLTIGFAPGQPYLGLLPENWNIPRQTELTPKVPAGALVVAVRQLVLFNQDSTTGWRQVGQCAFRPFLLDRPEPILLKAGDAMQFHAVSASDMNALLANNPDGLGGAQCEVLS